MFDEKQGWHYCAKKVHAALRGMFGQYSKLLSHNCVSVKAQNRHQVSPIALHLAQSLVLRFLRNVSNFRISAMFQ